MQTALRTIGQPALLRPVGSSEGSRARRVEWHLGVLCTIVVLPLLGFVGLLLWQYTGAERLRLRQEGAELLHTITVVVEKDLAAQGAMVDLAAHSPALMSEDLPSVRRSLEELARALDMRIVLRTVTGDPLFDTLRQQGPRGWVEHEEDQLARTARRPVASNLLSDASSPEPFIAITAPVVRQGSRDVAYLLSFAFSPNRISQAVSQEAGRPGTLALVLDGKGRTIASSSAQDIRVGQSLPGIASQVSGRGGHLAADLPGGMRFVGQYRRLNGADWTVVAGLDEDILTKPMRRFLVQLGGLGLTACLLSVALALIFGGRIAGAIGALRSAAAALEAGHPVTLKETPVTQVNAAGHALVSAADVIARSRAQQAFLNRELHHRVKNSLATVQAVVLSVARSSENLDAFRASISDRLHSLSKTHDLLVGKGQEGASLRDILESELQPYRGDGVQRVELRGPPVQLPTDAALPIAMLVHELVTNAAKYGALSVPTGRLCVNWSLAQEAQGPELTLTWAETGGPHVKEPAREGFGSKLIDRVARQLNGTIFKTFAAVGLTVELSTPLLDRPAPVSLDQ